MTALLIRGGRLLDQDGERDGDVRVADGRIADVGVDLAVEDGDDVLDARGCIVSPGFVDLHVHLREPGKEEAETIETGSRAAALGGFTAIVAMPNTDPTQDCVEVVDFVRQQAARAGLCEVLPAAAITVGRNGTQLAPFAELAAVGVRIFTPNYEMAFAGHPTLGTAHVCRALGLGGDQLGLEMRAGIIPVTAQGDHWTLRAAASTSRLVETSAAEIARLLGLESGDIGFQPLWLKAGREQLIIPLTSEAAVRRARPKPEMFEKLRSVDGAGQALVFASTGAKKIMSRFFFPDGASILEDPATGSACANLGGWFLAMGRRPPLTFEISQGELIGRPSILQLEVNTDNEVFVGGEVIELGSGILNF